MLQKERERSKKEKRKEERRAKKEKKKARQQSENSENVKHEHRKRKYLTDDNVTETSNEQLEKSGLTEDHGQPHSIQTGYDSPERSQDSSKRRKLSSASPIHGNNGTVLRIKLPSMKQREPGSSVTMSVVQSRFPGQGAIVKERVPQSYGVISHIGLQPPARVTQMERITTPLGQGNAERPALKLKLKTTDPEQPASKFKLEIRDSDTAAAKQKQSSELKLETRDSDTAVTRKPRLKVEERHLDSAASKQKQSPELKHEARDSDTAAVKQKKLEKHVASDEPCFSGRDTGTALEVEVAGATRILSSSGRKLSVSEEEQMFRELIVCWNPPKLQFDDSSIADEDWLFGTAKSQRKSNPKKCVVSEEPLLSQGNDGSNSLQPRACYLPDLDMYQLPYVVPF
ncbi:uncharacterized protein [Typha angustifolia]|uniref:uncharacterized protein isoform X2 n=1 Tax=Typha angustifolia TaxID=59011 RepID=UPI003C2E872B